MEGGVQIPRRGLTENFNMAKINNLATPGQGGTLPPPPLDPPMYKRIMVQSSQYRMLFVNECELCCFYDDIILC